MEEETRLCIKKGLSEILKKIFKTKFPDIKYESPTITLSEEKTDYISEKYSKTLDGYYDASRRTIYLRPSNIVISTILHELVHHMQFLRANKDIYKSFSIDLTLHINEQLHEIEAHRISYELLPKYKKQIEDMIAHCFLRTAHLKKE